jgi:hypothetical protein
VTPRDEAFEVLVRIARQAGMDNRLLTECIERRLLPTEGEEWEEEAYLVACRIRRLTSLGVNIQGMEVVLHMRRRQLSLQRELDRLRSELTALRRARDREMARLLRELSHEPE